MRRFIAVAIGVAFVVATCATASAVDLATGSSVPTTRSVNTTSPLGGGGALSGDLTLTCTTCVTATSAFATDNVILRSDGTGRGAQFTGITVDDSNLVGLGTAAPTHTLTLASTATGSAAYNTSDQVTNYERALCSWVANVYTCDVQKAGSGTARAYKLNTDAYSVTIGATSGSNGMLLTGGNASQFYINSGSSATGIRLVGNISTTATPVVQIAPNSGFTGSTTSQVALSVTGTFNQTSTATGTALLLNPTFTACGSGGCIFARAVDNATERWRLDSAGATDVDSTITTAGTTGNVTINKPCGTANIAAAGTAVTVTNSLVTANTIMSVLPRTNDSTCRLANYVPGSGTVTFNMTAACNAETSIGFCIEDRN